MRRITTGFLKKQIHSSLLSEHFLQLLKSDSDYASLTMYFVFVSVPYRTSLGTRFSNRLPNNIVF